MAVKFLEPGGDADFGTGLWLVYDGAPSIVTDHVHGGHIKSIKYKPITGASQQLLKTGVLGNAGRISIWFYLVARPSGSIARIIKAKQTADATVVWSLSINASGVLQLYNNGLTQIGSNGSALSTGQWYRISVAWNISSTTVYDINTFVNGSADITAHNPATALTDINPADIYIGNIDDTQLDLRSSDHYIDDSGALTDPGNIWVTAKRPFSNGTTTGFTTGIGADGAYGSGHALRENERPLNNANGWSMIGAGSAVTEEYTIEGKSVGDIDISTATIVDYMGWVDAKSALSETASIVVGGTTSNISLTSTEAIFVKMAGSSTYPAGGTDIGIVTSTTVTTVSLYEAGVIVAYTPASTTTSTSSSSSSSSSVSTSSSSSSHSTSSSSSSSVSTSSSSSSVSTSSSSSSHSTSSSSSSVSSSSSSSSVSTSSSSTLVSTSTSSSSSSSISTSSSSSSVSTSSSSSSVSTSSSSSSHSTSSSSSSVSTSSSSSSVSTSSSSSSHSTSSSSSSSSISTSSSSSSSISSSSSSQTNLTTSTSSSSLSTTSSVTTYDKPYINLTVPHVAIGVDVNRTAASASTNPVIIRVQ